MCACVDFDLCFWLDYCFRLIVVLFSQQFSFSYYNTMDVKCVCVVEWGRGEGRYVCGCVCTQTIHCGLLI